MAWKGELPLAGTFLGIEIGKRALMTHQRALWVISHNVGNANTPGYTRQVADLRATPSLDAPPYGHLGTGVDVVQIRRMHDAFTQIQLLQEEMSLGYWEEMAGRIGQVERFLMEPTESGIGQALDWFWEAWNELAKRPESIPEREVVLERARGVADAFRHTRQQLYELQLDLNRQIEVQVGEVNTLASRIAQLNKEIARVVRLGQQPNDLMDQRDELLRQLSTIVGFTIEDGKDGQISVRMGDHMLVDGDRAYRLETRTKPFPDDAQGDQPQFNAVEVIWPDGDLANLGTSKLQAMVELRDTHIQGWIQDLDDLAAALIASVNAVHTGGYDLYGQLGDDFFAGEGAWDIRLAITEPRRIAAADSRSGDDNGPVPHPGNGNTAKKMAELAKEKLDNLNMTADEAMESLLARVGSMGQESQVRVETQTVLLNHLEDQRASVSGVSLDEELTNMLRFEHAYAAAARVLTAVDSMLEHLILRTGRVGL